MGILIAFLVNAAALAVATYVIPGIHAGGAGSIFATALVFGFVNALVRPLAKLVTCPLIILTFGLFSLIVNALMLLLTAKIGHLFGIAFRVDGFWAAFLGAFLIAMVSTLLSWMFGLGRRAAHESA